MPDMEILSQMINDKAVEALTEDNYGKLLVTLREPQEPDSTVTIRDLPTDAFVIKMDSFQSPHDFFKGKKGECKRADYVIISAEEKTIVFIELKKTTDSFDDIVKQLLGAYCVIQYCQEVGRAFWATKGFLSKYKNRFVSIGHTDRIRKKKTKIEYINAPCDTIDKLMKISWPNKVFFNQIAGLRAK